MTALDRLVAGVRAELDALLPVLAEEVTAAVAERHALAVPRDVAPVVAALRGLRSVDDPSVERAVLGALGHPIEGAPMPEKQQQSAPADATTQPAPDWYADCPEAAAEPLAAFTAPPFTGDVIPLMVAALQIVDIGPLYLEATVELHSRLLDGRFDTDLMCCDTDLREGLGRRLDCLADDVPRLRKLVAFVGSDVLDRNEHTVKTRAWSRCMRYVETASETGNADHWLRAALAAVDVHRVMAGSVLLVHHIRVNEALTILGRMRETVELLGEPLDVLPVYTRYDQATIYDKFADHEATVALMEFIRGGGTDKAKAARARRIFRPAKSA